MQPKTHEQMAVAYIGGGSKGWAWKLMSDLASDHEIGGEVRLYDIDHEAALANEVIGNKIEHKNFTYKAVDSLAAALTGADFVVISILPATLDEMESDVHAPEACGILQPVGDSTGPGGILRAMRTIPMYVTIAQAIEKYSPNAWVINYTNPMAMCVDTLYRVFPGIKAFGCCHEVFGTQKLLASMLAELKGWKDIPRQEIRVNVKGLNHFTWIDKASYRGLDLFPLYREFALKYYETGFDENMFDEDPDNRMYGFTHRIKFDLFLRYGLIAAAGDRHLAEFCPGKWYLRDKATIKEWGFGITPVSERKESYLRRMEKSAALQNGKQDFEIDISGEEGVVQMKAIMGLGDLVTNVNLPNRGQIPNFPLERVVETNAHFSSDKVTPVMAGELPGIPHGLSMRVSDNYNEVVTACLKGDVQGCLRAFQNDPLVNIPPQEAEKLFFTMVENTKKYLGDYSL